MRKKHSIQHYILWRCVLKTKTSCYKEDVYRNFYFFQVKDAYDATTKGFMAVISMLEDHITKLSLIWKIKLKIKLFLYLVVKVV